MVLSQHAPLCVNAKDKKEKSSTTKKITLGFSFSKPRPVLIMPEDPKAAQQLLFRHLSLSDIDAYVTLLHDARDKGMAVGEFSNGGHTLFTHCAQLRCSVGVIRALLEVIDSPSHLEVPHIPSGRTIMHFLAELPAYAGVVKSVLATCPALASARSLLGDTALDHAVRQRDNDEIVELLVDALCEDQSALERSLCTLAIRCTQSASSVVYGKLLLKHVPDFNQARMRRVGCEGKDSDSGMAFPLLCAVYRRRGLFRLLLLSNTHQVSAAVSTGGFESKSLARVVAENGWGDELSRLVASDTLCKAILVKNLVKVASQAAGSSLFRYVVGHVFLKDVLLERLIVPNELCSIIAAYAMSDKELLFREENGDYVFRLATLRL